MPAADNAGKVWEPSAQRIKNAQITAFISGLERSGFGPLKSFSALHSWSIEQPELFWQAVWDFTGIRASKRASRPLQNPGRMPGAVWFEEAELNFAENLLRFDDDQIAVVYRAEDAARRTLTYRELHSEVARAAAAFRSWGVTAGDRVVGYLPNMPETIIAMLAAASIGAIWSACSPDFGVTGVVDRLGQIEPKVLVAADGYYFKGAPVSYLEKVKEVAAAIPSVRHVVIAPQLSTKPDLTNFPNALLWNALPSENKITFTQLPFNHPLYVMFSSGTTGKPKCIVHGAGGTLIEHLKELILHTDLHRSDVFMYQTTCSWMMWHWLTSGLATGCTIVLYEGSPLHRGGNAILDLLDEERISIFGTNAKFLALLEKESLRPGKTHKLEALRTILSTGSVLLPESFDFVYRSIKSDVCLASISGGTDIIGCFTLGCPIVPVYRSESQVLSLGCDVQVFSAEGKRIRGEKGELVCVHPFPSMPIFFWNDPEGEKFRAAYFSRFPNVWYHGDYVEETEHGGMIYFGRADAVLKPGGVRIGTAEIYRQVERLPEIAESVAIGQEWHGDIRIVLFVKLAAGTKLTAALQKKIRESIRANLSPFHVPHKILAVTDIPRTKNNKISELAVRDAVHGREIKNLEALANPESLEQFKNLAELHT